MLESVLNDPMIYEGKEVVRDGGQTSNEIVPAELPIVRLLSSVLLSI